MQQLFKPKRIILVRHGESAGNVDKGLYSTIPDYALELTDRGKEQAFEAGKEIKNIIGDESVRFYVSTHKRTCQTYECILQKINKKQVDIEQTYFDPRLREQDWGNLREASATVQIESERDSYGAFHYRFPHGESCGDVYDRLSTFLDTLHRDWEKNPPQNNVIITHGRTMRVFLMRWFKWRPEEFEKYKNPRNCQVVIMQLNEETNHYDLITKMEKY